MITQPFNRDAAAASPPISNIFLIVLLFVTRDLHAGNGAVGILLSTVVFRDNDDDFVVMPPVVIMFMHDTAAQKDGRCQRQQDDTFHIHS
jgi:hypothetical protein